MLIANAEVAGRPLSIRLSDGVIREVGEHLIARPGEEALDAGGGALLPGLHDHHLHLFSLAASMRSVECGPPRVQSFQALSEALNHATPDSGWIRGTGYFESVAGELDRQKLDALGVRHPLRIQHRSGSMWFLNTLAIEALGLDREARIATSDMGAEIERDRSGRSTGKLFRADAWLRKQMPPAEPPSLESVGRRLAQYGITQVTDATPSNGAAESAVFCAAQDRGDLPQRLRMMGGLPLVARPNNEFFEIGEFKIMLDEPALPDFDDLTASIRAAHESGRAVAIHSVTRTEIHFALAALESAGVLDGDRLEHASVAPDEAFDHARRLDLSIVTQPNFVSERGDDYRHNVDPEDLQHLYRVRSWLDAGVRLAAGTDAPFGDANPWRAMSAAVNRKASSGDCLGPDEIVSPETALSLFVDGFARGNAESTPFSVGRRADFCLLEVPWREARENLADVRAMATFCRGQAIWIANP